MTLPMLVMLVRSAKPSVSASERSRVGEPIRHEVGQTCLRHII